MQRPHSGIKGVKRSSHRFPTKRFNGVPMVPKIKIMIAEDHYRKEKRKDKSKDQVTIVCYTDPLCCWSWGLQPHLQRLMGEFPKISIEYCMGGLIPDWTTF